MKIRNFFIKPASDALGALLGPGNRIDVLALLAAERDLRTFARFLEGIEVLRQKQLKEHGATLRGGAKTYAFPSPEAKGLFDLAFTELMNAEQEVELEPIDEKHILAGFYRHPPTLPSGEPNPNAGKREPLDWDGHHFLLLRDLGIVTGKQPEPEDVVPFAPDGPTASEADAVDAAVQMMDDLDRALGDGGPVPDPR